MIDETLKKIETSIAKVPDEKREELKDLVCQLKEEINNLSKTHKDGAESIAGFTHVTTHEATREDGDPQLLKLSLDGLKTSARKFEASHPKLAEAVNSISNALASLGL